MKQSCAALSAALTLVSVTAMAADYPAPRQGDFVAKDRELAQAQEGDLLAIMSAGAYGFAMSSNYNTRPRAVEVLVDGDSYTIVRRRETYEDLVAGETAL